MQCYVFLWEKPLPYYTCADIDPTPYQVDHHPKTLKSEEIICPIMLSIFLSVLGVDSREDLISELDPNHREGCD